MIPAPPCRPAAALPLAPASVAAPRRGTRHFAVIAPPLLSHTRTLEALAAALVDRGHRVSWFAVPDVAAMLRDRRIAFVAAGADRWPSGSLAAFAALASRATGPVQLWRLIRALAAHTEALCADARRLLPAHGVDAIVADEMEAAGGLLAAGLGLPFVSVACALPVNREAAIPLPVMPWGYAVDAAALERNRVSARVHDALMHPLAAAIARQAAALGLARRATLEDCLSPWLQISQTPAAFDFPRSAAPAVFHAVGPLRPPPADEPPLGLPLRSDRPFVFASLGTTQGWRWRLLRRIAGACREIDAQLLVAHCGGLSAVQADALHAEGATWVTDFAPQRAAIARADVVVSHAGLNTVLDTLDAGKPSLALPITFDQPGVAARLVHAGAGLRLSPAWAGERSIAGALARLLREPAFAQRAAAVGRAVAASMSHADAERRDDGRHAVGDAAVAATPAGDDRTRAATTAPSGVARAVALVEAALAAPVAAARRADRAEAAVGA